MTAVVSDPTAYLYGACGAVAALALASTGAAIGTMQSGKGIIEPEENNNGGSTTELKRLTEDVECQIARSYNTQQQHPRQFKAMIPVVISGVLGIYGLIVAVVIQVGLQTPGYNTVQGYLHLCSGLSVGIPCLFAGIAIGQVGRYAKKATSFVAMVLILIFAEALGLYGLIVALLLNNQAVLAGPVPVQ